MSVEEIVEKVNQVDIISVKRVIKKLLATVPTLTALGPISNLVSYEKFCDRLK